MNGLRHARTSLAQLAGPGTFLVDSGRGHHLYLALGTWTEPKVIEQLNKMLRRAFHADAKFCDESLLRLCGTLNHKPLVFGYGEARPVQIEQEWS